jgi:RNA polymerase sigma factor (sigma-70 family)
VPETSSAASERIEENIDLHRAVLSLPRREREAVALVYQLDLSVQQAAERMGVADGTVKSLLSRARHHLAASLNDEDIEVHR